MNGGDAISSPETFYKIKESEEMLELEETIKQIQELTEKIKNLGESL